MSKTIIDITPDKSLIQKLGRTGYRTEEAISELIDNSIDARISGRTERIRVTLDFTSEVIAVSDDGAGMDIDELKKGLIIARGTKTKKNALGKFGLGMKSACSTLSKTFTITTSRPDSSQEFVAHYDENAWLEDPSKTWSNFVVEIRGKTNPWNGTIIRISDINVPFYPSQVTDFKKKFGLRYASYIKSKQISLYINDKECKPVDFPMRKETVQKLKIHINNNYVTGWVGLLPKRSIKGDYGIHLYKNDRLIKAFDKFGLRNHPEIAQIVGELNLDHIPVNFHKTDFIRDSSEYILAEKAFRESPVVIDLLNSIKRNSPQPKLIQFIFDYFENDIIAEKIKSRMSKRDSEYLLKHASTVNVSYGGKNINFEFIDLCNDKLYSIEKTENGFSITINRKSHLFNLVGNPLFLFGLVGSEIKTMTKDIKKHDDFLAERNCLWAKFVLDWSSGPEKIMPDRQHQISPHSKYSLVGELVKARKFLEENFEFSFQFTALSTLEPFLQHAYNKMIYTIKTTKHTGEQLLDNLTERFAEDYTILLNPTSASLDLALNISSLKKLVVIREYTTIPKNTYATPANAWFDLLSEIKRNQRYPIYDTELDHILENLINFNLVTKSEMASIARHKNILPEVEKYIGGLL